MSFAALRSGPTGWQVFMAVLAAVVAALVAIGSSTPRPRWWVLTGTPVALAAAMLYDVTPLGLATVIIAVLAGAAFGLAAPRRRQPIQPFLACCSAGVASVVLARVVGSMHWGLAVAVLTTLVSTVATLLAPSPAERQRRRRSGWVVPVVAVLAALGLAGWTGANNSQVWWFGAVIAHGPTDGNRVAITFDDGPNATATLEVRDILDRYGVKATFFLVGKALDNRPDVAKAMLADGMLLGGHSYHHDAWRWLDPRYPELDRTVAAFRRQLGICPHFYRPPHGQRTPFLVAEVHRQGMEVAMWDLSAGDWATHDARLVADRILRGVKPGSIVLLHDSLDGDVHADRSVIVAALPLILDGLRARGLQPVRLDELVGGPAYNASC
jgi:peptidoglycan/xylan/chitin deacetylase (PgdA/CDA1 family)